MATDFSASLVSTQWLADNLGRSDLIVIDGSFKLPGVTPLAKDDFETRHIPGARFFDIDAISDHASSLPHMLPSESEFEEAMETIGVSSDSFVVVYDTLGLMSAGRIWWTFRVFGHDRVGILDGGLKSWLAEGREVTAGKMVVAPAAPGSFKARFDDSRVVSKSQVMDNIQTSERQLVDARSTARFNAIEKEARPGLRSGHIPGSFNLPFGALTNADTGKMKTATQIRQLFEESGMDLSKPVIASCGSGVTACALVFGMYLTGKDDVSVYDGAWTEWGMPGVTPVEP